MVSLNPEILKCSDGVRTMYPCQISRGVETALPEIHQILKNAHALLLGDLPCLFEVWGGGGGGTGQQVRGKIFFFPSFPSLSSFSSFPSAFPSFSSLLSSFSFYYYYYLFYTEHDTPQQTEKKRKMSRSVIIAAKFVRVEGSNEVEVSK